MIGNQIANFATLVPKVTVKPCNHSNVPGSLEERKMMDEFFSSHAGKPP